MSTLTKYWFLEGFNLFRKLGMPTMMQLCKILEMQYVNKGEVIALGNRSKRCIFFLKTGTVKIVDTKSDTVKYVVKKGNIFGELSLYDEKAALEEQAFALEDCVVCYIEADTMEELMEKHKSLKNGVLKVYGIRIKKLERRLENLLYRDSASRIEDFVMDYVQEFGEMANGEIRARNLLSHKDIAHLTNTSRQTVSNTLSSLRKFGTLTYDSKYISIPKSM
ncbi:Crp/Fnr family transcriptional regulator [Spongiimicrobium sp. 3-5]|uniref:Crp/Fnr family transcriptional regulator n=1 Tax=Spongiimicrobium sp. 3-5 TaxID=3332596 RepID=UPI00398179CF